MRLQSREDVCWEILHERKVNLKVRLLFHCDCRCIGYARFVIHSVSTSSSVACICLLPESNIFLVRPYCILIIQPG